MPNGYVLAELTHQNKVTKIFYHMLLSIGTEKFLSSSQGAQGMDRQNDLSLLPLYLWPFQVCFFSTYPSIGLLRVIVILSLLPFLKQRGRKSLLVFNIEESYSLNSETL